MSGFNVLSEDVGEKIGRSGRRALGASVVLIAVCMTISVGFLFVAEREDRMVFTVLSTLISALLVTALYVLYKLRIAYWRAFRVLEKELSKRTPEKVRGVLLTEGAPLTERKLCFTPLSFDTGSTVKRERVPRQLLLLRETGTMFRPGASYDMRVVDNIILSAKEEVNGEAQ